jgi:hypothetical protein
MKFIYPEFLWAFVLLTIPVVIHLFNFKRYKTLYFSSLTFLKSVTQQTKSVQKVKHIITLILRLLAFSALILAFAQPYIPQQKNVGASLNTLIAVYIDNSYSMQAKGEGGILLSEAKEAARAIAEKTPLGTSFMLLTNELSGSQFRFLTKNEFQTGLDQLDFYPGAIQLENVIKGIERTLESTSENYDCQLIMFSDFQENTLNTSVAFRDTTHSIFPVRLVPQNKENIYIDSVWFDQPLRRVNQNNNLMVRIVNHGPALTNVSVDLKVNDYSRQTLTDLVENGETILSFNYTDKSTGWKNASVEVADKHMYFDDVFYFSYEVKQGMKVLIVNDEGSTRFPEFVFDTESFFDVTTIPVGQLKPETLKQHDVLIMNGIKDLTSGLQQIIRDFLAENKSAVLIPGSNSFLNSYNVFLNASAMPIFSGKKSNSLLLNKVNYDDPFFNGVFDKHPETINLPRILSVFDPQATTKTNAIPLVQFENGKSMVMQSGGSEKLMVFYIGLSDDFGKFHEHILFSTLLLRAGELSQSGGRMWFTHDQDEVITIRRPSGYQGAITLKSEQLEIIPPSRKSGNMEILYPGKNELGVTLNQGHYNVLAGTTDLGHIAINLNRAESIPEYLSDEEIISQIKQKNVSSLEVVSITNVSERDQFSINKPLEYWRILLILGFVFLLTEMLITLLWRV